MASDGSTGRSLNDYHIYEEIGKGKQSIVYKGRRKKSIEYVAIKSVDKSQRERLMNELSILCRMSHPNILAFHSWYETHNHLWLIMEYCTGGDLLGVLRQDKAIPEASVRAFAIDIIAGMQYLHSNGILFCDLKPSNVLLNEFGVLKLCDLGLARPIAADRAALQQQAATKRGTPYYMAPELFHRDGLHSFASDFWALGCVLYELASGRPPFYAKNLQELVNLILNSAPARLPAPFTDSFNDLIGRLLEKDATSRLDWPRLLSHPFFLNSNLALPAPLPLPPQPLFDQLVAAKQQPVRKTPSPTPSIASSPTPTQRTSPTPAETSARKSPSPGPQAPTVSGVDILRLSMNAKRHLSCEQDEYAARQPSSRLMSARDVPQSSLPAETSTSSSVEAQSDVEMQNYDVELNFGGAQDAENESEADDCAAAASATPAPRFEENDVEDDAGFDEVTELESPPSPSAAAAFDNARAAGSRPTSAIESPSTLQSASLVARPADTLSTRIDELMLHATDVAVKPLIGNPKIEKTVECKFDPKALPFRAFAVDEVLEMPKAELETFLSLIYKSISGDSTPITSAGGVTPPTSSATATLREKTNALGYFESLCSNAGVANVVINSSLMTMLVRLCVGDSNPAGNNAAGTNTTVAAAVTQAVANRAQLLHILGLLLRHATWIADELSDSGIVQTLAELLRDKSVKVRRKAVAALGELLFYIATHHETLPPGPARDRVWPVSKFAINMLLRGLRADEDECVQHYVAKAIENIAAQAAECAVEWFSQTEVMYSLLHIYNSSRSEHLRTTVASALSHLMRRNPALINSFLEKVGMLAVRAGLEESSAPRLQQAFLNILNRALRDRLPRLQRVLEADKKFLPCVLQLLEHPSSVIRAKALLCLSLLALSQPSVWLIRCGDAKLGPIIDRLARVAGGAAADNDKDAYLRACLSILSSTCADCIQPLCVTLGEEARKLVPKTPTPSAGPNSAAAARQVKELLLPSLTLVFQLLQSSVLREAIVTSKLVGNLSSYLPFTETLVFAGSAHAEFKQLVFSCVEALSQSSTALSAVCESVVAQLLPALLALLGSENGDTRFLSLKIFTDICSAYLSDRSIYDPAALSGPQTPTFATTKALNELLVTNFLAKCKNILADKEPIPQYCLKTLWAMVNANAAFISVLNRFSLFPRLVSFMQPDHQNLSLHGIRLVASAVKVRDADKLQLLRAGIAERSLSVLSLTLRSHLGADWIEPLAEIVQHLFQHAIVLSSQPANDDELKTTLVALRPLADLESISTLCSTLVSPEVAEEPGVAELISQSLQLCLQLFPQAADTLVKGVSLDNIGRALLMFADSSASTCLRLLKVCSSLTTRHASLLLQTDSLTQALRSLTAAPPDAVVGTATSALRELLGMRF